eukprot:718380-Heterocapsa_arctica.AAC.1
MSSPYVMILLRGPFIRQGPFSLLLFMSSARPDYSSTLSPAKRKPSFHCRALALGDSCDSFESKGYRALAPLM